MQNCSEGSHREKTGIRIVTEVMDTEQVEAVAASADIIQIGTRNMQNGIKKHA